MLDKHRTIATGGLIGLLVAGTLALPGLLPPAMADDEPARTMLKTGDELLPDKLTAEMFVKPDWTFEPWVSQEPLSQTTVKKIGYGKTTVVSIVTTSTGTYSSDAMSSPHVLYPGISRTTPARSFEIIVPNRHGYVTIDPEGACVELAWAVYC